MTYTIRIHLIQDFDFPFIVEEKGVHCGTGTWESEGMFNLALTLTMPSSGTSGALICRRPRDGDSCCIVLGVHNYRPWCNVVTDLAPSDTAASILDSFYGKGIRNQGWVQVVEEQKTTKKGTLADVRFFRKEGYSLAATINITT